MSFFFRNRSPLDELEFRLKAILPEEYQDSCEEVQPVSMGSAALKYGRDGKVAWNDIWDTFCDLAMAGGPPHKGMLLEPGSSADIEARPDAYRAVTEEICRGVTLVTELPAEPSPDPGWVRVKCAGTGMAGWLLRAVVMENISARAEGAFLDLPAGPAYRVEKEVKNVITVIAKTCHYWGGHLWSGEQQMISSLFAQMERESPLAQPGLSGPDDAMADRIRRATGLGLSSHRYAGWLGLECPDVPGAIWMMRALVASNVLSRREDTVLFVPVNAAADPDGERVAQSVIQIHGFARAKGVL